MFEPAWNRPDSLVCLVWYLTALGATGDSTEQMQSFVDNDLVGLVLDLASGLLDFAGEKNPFGCWAGVARLVLTLPPQMLLVRTAFKEHIAFRKTLPLPTSPPPLPLRTCPYTIPTAGTKGASSYT